MDKCYQRIRLNPTGSALSGMRLTGRVDCSVSDMEHAIGKRHGYGKDLNQSAEWFIETPRGRVIIADHHRLPQGQLMLVCEDFRASAWVCAYLRKLGVVASVLRQTHTGESE